MNQGLIGIHRKKKWDWAPLLRFGGGQSRIGQSDGWHNSKPYGNPDVRTMGVRYHNPLNQVTDYQVAYRNTYVTNENTDLDWSMSIKYPIDKLKAIWYRYRYVDGFLQNFSDMPELSVLSIRDHMVDFGHLDLSQNPDFSHLEISTHFSIEGDILNGRRIGGRADSVTFNTSALLKFIYLSGCDIPQTFVDECLMRCYVGRNGILPYGYSIPSSQIPSARIDQGYDPAWNNFNNSFLSQRVSWSASLQYMVDELKNDYGWTGFEFY